MSPPPQQFLYVPQPPHSSSDTSDTIVGFTVIAFLIVLVVALVGLCCYMWGRRKRRKDALTSQGLGDDSADLPLRRWKQQQLPVAQPAAAPSTGSRGGTREDEPPRRPPLGKSLGPSNNIFTYEELEAATDGFSKANFLGQGGFGYVHKGVLSNGVQVAVKQLKAESEQGEREFQAEVEIISRIHHRNLVLLLGYCITGSARMLVFEFVPNNTLELHLHGNGRPIMTWATRMKIAVASARGLAYLHEDCRPKIIHRDIKAANILLDNRFEAKVADFGLAKFTSDIETHISTRVAGTFGYLAPEYALSGRLTAKSDVYSFGVILLELLTGHVPIRMIEDKPMVNWAKPLLTQAMEDGSFDGIADPRLQNNYNCSEMARMVACAASCLRDSAQHRPRMSLIVRGLEGSDPTTELNEPGVYTAFYSYGIYNEEEATYTQSTASECRGQSIGEQTGSSIEVQQAQNIRTREGIRRGTRASSLSRTWSGMLREANQIKAND